MIMDQAIILLAFEMFLQLKEAFKGSFLVKLSHDIFLFCHLLHLI